jgi:hypothetical protein
MIVFRPAAAALVACQVLAVILVQKACADPSDLTSRDARERKQTTEAVEVELPKWKMWLGLNRERELKLESKSVLRWTNPGTHRVYGDVFVWTLNGRPEVVMSLFKVWEPPRGMHSEMHSLSPTEVTAERDGSVIWHPAKSGISYQDLPEAPPPADVAVRRLQQMRSLAKGFSAELVDRRVNDQGERQVLRLLPAPIFRYQSTDPDVIDGAMFAIVLGTDPEVFLLLEAQRTEKSAIWRYALARMNDENMIVRYQDNEVWRVERAKSRQSLPDPYFLSGLPEKH